MAPSNFRRLLLASLTVTFLLAGCSDGEEAQKEADAMAERTEDAIEDSPATERSALQEPDAARTIPAPDNVGAPPEDAGKTSNGVAYIVLENTAGETRPTVQDTVIVHYTGWTTDGVMFDSSVARGEPATFPLNQLITGWQEAVPLMNVGDKYRFWIPGELAYDASTRAGAPKGMLVFDIELLGIETAAQPQPGGRGESGGN